MGISPYEAGLATGNSLGEGFRISKEKDVLTDVLNNAMNTDDPNVLQQSITTILSQVRPENQKNAIDALDKKLTRIAEERKSKNQSIAALEGGYNQYAPPGVQSKQAQAKIDQEQNQAFFVKKQAAYEREGLDPNLPDSVNKAKFEANAKQKRLDSVYGQPNQGSPLPNPQAGGEPPLPIGAQPSQGLDGTAPPTPISPQQVSGQNPFAKKTKDELITLTGHPDKEISEPAKAQLKEIEAVEKITQKLSESDRKKFESDRDFHTKQSQPAIEAANAEIKKYPIRKGLANQQRMDIESGNIKGIGPYLVDKTGFEFWRTPEEARFKTAAKQRFVENLSSIGGGVRPNMFIEQQLVSAQPALGRDEEANLTVLDMEEFIDDLDYRRAKYIQELAKKDRAEFGFVKSDVEERADEKMADYTPARQEKLALDIRERQEKKLTDEDLVKQIVSGDITKGTPLTMRAASILMIKNGDDESKAQKEALSLGFTIPKYAGQ